MEDAGEENWHGLVRGFSDETADLLDEVAVIYTAAGAPFDNQGEKLLASLVSETDFLVFSDVVVSVEFRNEKAYLISGQDSSCKGKNQWSRLAELGRRQNLAGPTGRLEVHLRQRRLAPENRIGWQTISSY
jgi:hypothetical protein